MGIFSFRGNTAVMEEESETEKYLEYRLQKVKEDYERSVREHDKFLLDMKIVKEKNIKVLSKLGRMHVLDKGFVVPVDNLKLKDYEMSLVDDRGI